MGVISDTDTDSFYNASAGNTAYTIAGSSMLAGKQEKTQLGNVYTLFQGGYP